MTTAQANSQSFLNREMILEIFLEAEIAGDQMLMFWSSKAYLNFHYPANPFTLH